MRIIGDRLFIDLPGSGEPSPDGRIDGGTAWGTHLTDIAATGLLLGTTSDMETVAMMLDVSKRVADPGVIDAESGRNAWTSAYEQLEHDALVDLNQVRAASLHRAFKANGALAADGRAETRRLLGLDATTIVDSYEADAALAARGRWTNRTPASRWSRRYGCPPAWTPRASPPCSQSMRRKSPRREPDF